MKVKPITVQSEPIKGTLMHRRHEGKREINPEYLGSDLEGAKRDASSLSLRCFTFQGHTYELVEGQWYKLVLS